MSDDVQQRRSKYDRNRKDTCEIVCPHCQVTFYLCEKYAAHKSNCPPLSRPTRCWKCYETFFTLPTFAAHRC